MKRARPEAAAVASASQTPAPEEPALDAAPAQHAIVEPPQHFRFLNPELADASKLDEATWQAVLAFRDEHEIAVHGSAVPAPVPDFESLPARCTHMADAVQKAAAVIAGMGHAAPTAIQAQAWPIALAGRDMIGLAETGSGKTLAYAVPAAVHAAAALKARTDADNTGAALGPFALVLAPTRELADQIDAALAAFCGALELQHTCVYGGVPKAPQARALKMGVHALVATPGRLEDHVAARACSLERVTFVVLDEADRMLSMGFEAQLRGIMAQVSSRRQCLLWSATWPASVQALADEMQHDPVRVVIANAGLKANHNIAQSFAVLKDDGDKYEALEATLDKDFIGSRMLVFIGTKKGVDTLTRQLRTAGWPAMGIHGDKSQIEREWVLREFRSGNSPIMLATDVAARGLDIKDVAMVINYDMPLRAEEYVQRIGRTARAGAAGAAVSFFVPGDARLATEVVHVLREARQPVPSELLRFAAAQPAAA